jgi:hypothetical protein
MPEINNFKVIIIEMTFLNKDNDSFIALMTKGDTDELSSLALISLNTPLPK